MLQSKILGSPWRWIYDIVRPCGVHGYVKINSCWATCASCLECITYSIFRQPNAYIYMSGISSVSIRFDTFMKVMLYIYIYHFSKWFAVCTDYIRFEQMSGGIRILPIASLLWIRQAYWTCFHCLLWNTQSTVSTCYLKSLHSPNKFNNTWCSYCRSKIALEYVRCPQNQKKGPRMIDVFSMVE